MKQLFKGLLTKWLPLDQLMQSLIIERFEEKNFKWKKVLMLGLAISENPSPFVGNFTK